MSEFRQRDKSDDPTLSSMTSQQSRELVQRAWKAFATRDPLQISPVFHETAEWLAPAGNATALALDVPHRMVGRDMIVGFLTRDFPRLFTGAVSIDFRGFYADGNTVIVEETMSATLSNGSHYTNDYCFIFELRNGLIHRVREYMDTAKGMRMVFAEFDPVRSTVERR